MIVIMKIMRMKMKNNKMFNKNDFFILFYNIKSTKMEKLNSDEKMSILMKLTASEILKVCQTNKELSRACGDVRYNPLWYSKIKEDFNVIYKGENTGNSQNAYEEYKRLFLLYHTEIFTVTIADTNSKEYFSELFLTREDAENYIFQSFSYNNEYVKIKNSLKYVNSYEYAENVYTISKTYIQKKDNMRDEEELQKLEEQEKEYTEKIEAFYNLFNDMEEKDDIIDEFKQLIDDSITEMQGKTYYSKEQYIVNNVSKQIKDYIKEYNLQDYEKEIKDYLDYIL